MKERVFFEEFESLYYYHGSTHNWAMEGFHFHSQYEIILFLNDGSTMEIEKQIYQVNAGDLFLINDKEYHRTNAAPGQSHNRYVFMFEPGLIKALSAAFGYNFVMYFENRDADFMHKIHLNKDNLEKMENRFLEIEHVINMGDDSPAGAARLKIAILQMLLEINEMYSFFLNGDEGTAAVHHEQTIGETDHEIEFKSPILKRDRIEEIKKYVKDHVSEKLELEDIAKKLYINKFYLSHYFKKETGFTLLQYITNQKIAEAKILLRKGMSITDIAMQLSYNSDSHFISVFKKNTGMTPKKYIKNKEASVQHDGKISNA